MTDNRDDMRQHGPSLLDWYVGPSGERYSADDPLSAADRSVEDLLASRIGRFGPPKVFYVSTPTRRESPDLSVMLRRIRAL